MCKLCKKHAEGYGKWYLNPKGYTEEFFTKLSLLDRILGRESKKVRKASKPDAAWFNLQISQLLDLLNLTKKPIIGPLIKKVGNYVLLRSHSGQVVPLEDAYKIVDLSYGHSVFPCMCKRMFKGQDEYKCLNFAPLTDLNRKAPRGWKEKRLSPEEAKEKLEEFSQKGYVHAVFWWYDIPQNVCICNCDNQYCFAARPKMWYDVQNAYLKAEYVAEVNKDDCISCGNCISRCQFGAIQFDNDERAVVDPRICFGCGQCRVTCEENAIQLLDRNTHLIANKIW